MGVKRLLLLLVIILPACGATFAYKFYGVDAVSYEGNLLGEKPEDDIPFARCKPDDVEKGKCVVMLKEEFFQMKADYLQTKQALIDCQKGNQNATVFE